MRRIPPHRWLAAVPAVFLLGGVPFVNRVRGLVLGFPPLLVWMVAWVLLTSAALAIVGRLDDRDAGSGPDDRG